MQSPSPELGRRMIRAGAGAGKTTTLVQTFIDFVKDFRGRKDEWPRIVVTTFTRKATQEVKERLLKKALELKEDEIFRYIGRKSFVHLSTIHGVLTLLLGRFGDRIDLSPDFRIGSSEEIENLARRELRRLLVERPEWQALIQAYSFRDLLKAAMAYREAAFLRADLKLASTEFFREQTMALIRRLVNDGPAWASQIEPALTKGNENWLRWAEVLGSLRTLPKTDGEISEFLARLRLMDESMTTKPMIKSGKSIIIDEVVGQPVRELLEEAWDPLIDEDKSYRFEPTYWKKHEDVGRMFESMAQEFRQRWDALLKENGVISMGDLENFSLELVQKAPDAAKAFSEEWDYWMIDEYQDTSPVQVALLNALVGDRPHFVVGDPQQSIYFFRGARSQVFMDKMREFENSDALLENRQTNYRSRGPVLEFFNEFFSGNEKFNPMAVGSTKDMNHEIPAAELRVVPENEEGKKGEAPVFAVIEKIQELLDAGVSAEKIAVLARQNQVLRDVMNEARRHQVPVQLHSAGGFAQRREIRDVNQFLRFLLNPSDNQNLVGLLRSPWFFLPDQQIHALCDRKAPSFWFNALRLHGAGSETHPVRRLQKWLETSNERGLAGCLASFYRQEGILDSSVIADPSGRREANLWKLLLQLEEAQRTAGFNGLAFVDGMDRSLSTEDGNDDGDASPAIEPKRVNLMTIHASKGLEFDHVIVAHMHMALKSEHSGLWEIDEATGQWTLAPKDTSGANETSLLAEQIRLQRDALLMEESHRLLYVAMTRAMQSVTLVWQQKQGKTGPIKAPSRSWAAKVPFPLGPDEVRESEKFKYQIRGTAPVTRILALDEKKIAELGESWSAESTEELVTSISPTTLLEKTAELKTGSERPAPSADMAARGLRIAQRGTDAHRLFESLKYVSPAKVLEMTADEKWRKAVSWLVALKDPPVYQVIQNGEAEWGFAVQRGSFILQGQIDLWGVVEDTLWLVDYKTGSMEYAEKALDQLAIYAWALLKLNALRPDQELKLAAVYPVDQKTKVRSFARADLLAPEWQRIFDQLDAGKIVSK